MIRKESGEAPEEQMNTSQPEIKLILSYSSYHLKIFAYNNVSHSPAVSHIIHGDINSKKIPFWFCFLSILSLDELGTEQIFFDNV